MEKEVAESSNQKPELGTRAVRIDLNGGDIYEDCVGCGDRIKFMGKKALDLSTHENGVVICNVYEGDRWDRIEPFHPDCYGTVGEPYGEVTIKSNKRTKK